MESCEWRLVWHAHERHDAERLDSLIDVTRPRVSRPRVCGPSAESTGLRRGSMTQRRGTGQGEMWNRQDEVIWPSGDQALDGEPVEVLAALLAAAGLGAGRLGENETVSVNLGQSGNQTASHSTKSTNYSGCQATSQ